MLSVFMTNRAFPGETNFHSINFERRGMSLTNFMEHGSKIEATVRAAEKANQQVYNGRFLRPSAFLDAAEGMGIPSTSEGSDEQV